jgi:hypothetical protein
MAMKSVAAALVPGQLRRGSKHWQSGDKCLAAIHLAQSGLGKLDSEAAYRLPLAAELIDAGVTPRELRRELGLGPVQFDISKYDENQPRVPAGSGPTSGEWTVADAGTIMTGVASEYVATHSGKEVNRVRDLPKDAVVVVRPDGVPVEDPTSANGMLMAPPKADFREVYAAGASSKPYDALAMYEALGHFGTFDFQRDRKVTVSMTNISMLPITLLASIWPVRVTINGRRSKLLKRMDFLGHRINTAPREKNGQSEAGLMQSKVLGKKSD